MMAKRLETLVQFMLEQADSGNEDFEKNVEEGHVKLYKSDILYILKNAQKIRDKNVKLAEMSKKYCNPLA